MPDLDSNRYAGPDEAALLRDDIASAELAKVDLERQISRAAKGLRDTERALLAAREAHASAESIHADLVALRGPLDQRTLRARGLLHPIRNLPNELLAMIFEEWRQACDSSDPEWSNPLHVPLYAGAVCRHWRRVAFNIPQLWSAIELYLERIDLHNIDSCVEYLNTYRTCARDRLLDVFVQGGWDNLPSSPASDKFWDAVDACFSRAETVYMEVGGHDLNRKIKSCVRSSRLNLKSFTFTVDLDSEADSHLMFFRSAPLLRSVRLWGVTLLWDDPEGIFPEVTSLAVHELDGDGLLDVFHHMPNITHLELTRFNIFSQTELSGVSLRNDLVVRLELNVGDISDAALVRNIHFPSLKAAVLSCSDRSTVSNETLTALLRHVFVTARDFTYEHDLDLALADGLKALTNVKILRVGGFGDTAEAMLEEISRPYARGAWMFPELDKLVLCHRVPRASLRTAIVRLARARGTCAPADERPPCPLRSVEFRDFPASRRIKSRLWMEIKNILGTE
ncbi:hypothetical protein AURDEDRAFT_163110 [Auricularia subglabra TFB-10046 SS5]|nr:hypothetical protein AURDEDRAFT_163110 [Auricularia subglabra TFB-10046 SS5]